MRDERKVYHGWIYREKEAGYHDHFRAEFKNDIGDRVVKEFGASPGAAVEFFDDRVGKRVQLEDTPLGLRVFTMEEDNRA